MDWASYVEFWIVGVVEREERTIYITDIAMSTYDQFLKHLNRVDGAVVLPYTI